MLDAFGGLDVLVNNAAVERNQPASKVTGDAIDETLFVNLRQAFMLCSAFAKPLFASQGSIVNITSTAATGAGGTQGAYAASKGGLNTLTKNLANEWASKGVRVNAVAPGLVDTEMWEPTFDRLGEDAVRKNFVKSVPLGRWGTADEIADVACFLASDQRVLRHRPGHPRRRRYDQPVARVPQPSRQLSSTGGTSVTWISWPSSAPTSCRRSPLQNVPGSYQFGGRSAPSRPIRS